MTDTPTSLNRVHFQDDSVSWMSNLSPDSKKHSRQSLMGTIFCHGGVPSEDGRSITSLPIMTRNSAESKGSSSRKSRRPLHSTDVLNKAISNDTAGTSQYDSGCFPETFGAFMHGRKGNKGSSSQLCSCSGACVSCWDSQSNSKMFSSFGLASPRDPNSNPVIEALGVTPKSKDRRSKYNVSGAMNSGGISIPTPAPTKRVQYRVEFDNIPESFTGIDSVKGEDDEGVTSLKRVDTDEDAFVPDDVLDKGNETKKIYTEADLQQRVQDALEEQQQEFMMRASGSEESDFNFQQQLQEQLEQQGMLWNKDLQDRLEANRQVYKKKQTVLRARINELEIQCRGFEKNQEEKATEHQQQLEALQLELSKCRQENEEERNKLREEIARKDEELTRLRQANPPSEEDTNCKPAFIMELQKKITTLQSAKEEAEKRALKSEKRVIGLEGQLSTHQTALAGVKDARKQDQQRIVEIETQLEVMAKNKVSLLAEIQALKNKIWIDSEGDAISTKVCVNGEQFADGQNDPKKHQELEKLKGVLRSCIQTLSTSVPDMGTNTTVPSDDNATLEQSLETIQNLANAMTQRVKQAETSTKAAIDARVEAELELAKLSEKAWSVSDSDVADEEDNEGAKETLQGTSDLVSYWEQRVSGTPKNEDSKQSVADHILQQTKALSMLREEIQSIQRLCVTQKGPAKDLLENHAWELQTKVAQASEQLELLHNQLTKQAATAVFPADPSKPLPKQGDTSKEAAVDNSSHALQLAVLTARLAELERKLTQKTEAVKALEAKHAEVLTELKASQEQNQNLESLLENKGIPRSLSGDEKQVEELLVMLELKQQNENLSDTVREQEEAAEMLQREKGELEEKVSILGGKCDALSKDLEARNKEIESLKEEQEKLTSQVSSLTRERDAMSKDLNERDLDADSLTAEVQEMKAKVSELTAQCETSTKALADRENEIDALKSEKEGLQQKCNNLTIAVDAKSTKLVSLARSSTKKGLERSFLRKKLLAIMASIEGDEAANADDKEIDDLQKIARIDQYLHKLQDDSTKQIEDLNQQMEQMRRSSAEMKSETDATIQNLNSKAQQLESNLSSKEKEIQQSTSKIASLEQELSATREEVERIQKQHKECVQSLNASLERRQELKDDRKRLLQQIAGLETRIDELSKELEFESAAANERRMHREELQQQLDASKSESSKLTARVAELEAELESNAAKCERVDELLSLRAQNTEEELLRKSAELEAKANETIARCTEQVRQCREEHAKEIDEMLAQLDLVEAEHREQCEEKEKAVKQKDAIIAALGAQLSESQGFIQKLEKMLDEHLKERQMAQEETAQARKDAAALRETIEDMRKSLDDLTANQHEAIEAAREETIQEANAQFEQFNEMYRNMRNNFQKASAKVLELEAELQNAKLAAEEMAKEHASIVATLKSELADIKADYAQEKAASARAFKERQDMERELQTRLSEAESSNRSVQKLLATIVAEKEALLAENENLHAEIEDIRSVAEEALSIADNTAYTAQSHQ